MSRGYENKELHARVAPGSPFVPRWLFGDLETTPSVGKRSADEERCMQELFSSEATPMRC